MNASNKYMRKKSFLLVFLFSTCIVVSCHKSDRDGDHENASVLDNLLALEIVNDVYYQVMDAASQQTEFYKTQSQCATISVSPAAPDSTFPKIMSIDYGTVSCPDDHAVNHSGKLEVQFSNKPGVYNTSITITFTDYSYNGAMVTGNVTIKNKGLNKEGNPVYYITVKDMLIMSDKKNYISYTCAYNKEWISGDDTPAVGDDAFYITGTSSGINHVGNSYTAKVDSSLRFDNTCKHFLSGTVLIYPKSLSMRKMDFGSGNCDGIINYNINGFSYELVEN
jgi:hypothetical protein